MKTHTAEVKVLMDLFAKYKGKMTPSELMKELKETKMRQVYDYLYWADREQGIVIKSHRTGRTVVAYEHVSGAAQAVTVEPTAKPDGKVVRLALKKALDANVVAVAKAAAKKVKPAKAVKTAAAKKVAAPKVSTVVEKPRKGEVSSYAVDADFDRDDALAIPDFLKRK